jgi:hypothetical protein
MRGISSCGGKLISAPVQPMSLRGQNLRTHQIHPGDDLGHRVFDLDARIDLDEKPFVLVQIVEKFHRAGVVEIDSPASRTAAWHKSFRTASSKAMDGAISMTF